MKGWFKYDKIFLSAIAYLIKLWPKNLFFGSTFMAYFYPRPAAV
jgi:hypothetical protein